MDTYDPRYLAGILFFNEQDFFEAHEVWEDLWSESHGDERRFYQGLIQAAVGLYHFTGGNLGGALKLYRSSHDYMAPCGSPFLGMDVTLFWQQMEQCFRPLLTASSPERTLRPVPELIPTIALSPPPAVWPNPEDYVTDED
jgi:predicted metal-dependent hydrolase